MKSPPRVINRWANGSLTRRPKGPIAVSWPRQFGKQNVITIVAKKDLGCLYHIVISKIVDNTHTM